MRRFILCSALFAAACNGNVELEVSPSTSSSGGASAVGASSSRSASGSVGVTAGAGGAAGESGAMSSVATASSATTTVASSSASGMQGGGLGPGFHLLATWWTGTVFETDAIDPMTGALNYVGNHGDVDSTNGDIVLDASGTHVYLGGGKSGSLTWYISTLDLTTGISSNVAQVQTQAYRLAGATDDGHLLGVFWNGSSEEVDLVDPTTGVGASVGVLGDLHTWGDFLTFDRTSNTVFALGSDANDKEYLYRLEVSTGMSSQDPFTWTPYVFPLAGFYDGSLIGTTWNGSGEMVKAIDPNSLTVTDKGLLGDLHDLAQIGAFTIDPSLGVAYCVGSPYASNSFSLYSLDLTNGGLTTATGLPMAYFLARP